MARSVYRIERGRVVSTARSSIHDTRTEWSTLAGTIEADPTTLTAGEAKAEIAVDMRAFDAGDFLKNRKLKKDLGVERHPEARFSLRGLRDVVDRGGGRFDAIADGEIAWRGRTAAIEARGSGTLDAVSLEATARFELDVTSLGVTPPRILMFKVEEVVTVEVELSARV